MGAKPVGVGHRVSTDLSNVVLANNLSLGYFSCHVERTKTEVL